MIIPLWSDTMGEKRRFSCPEAIDGRSGELTLLSINVTLSRLDPQYHG